MAFVSKEELQQLDRAKNTKDNHKCILGKYLDFCHAPTSQHGLGMPANWAPRMKAGYALDLSGRQQEGKNHDEIFSDFVTLMDTECVESNVYCVGSMLYLQKEKQVEHSEIYEPLYLCIQSKWIMWYLPGHNDTSTYLLAALFDER
eukprot:124642_1